MIESLEGGTPIARPPPSRTTGTVMATEAPDDV